MTLNGTLVRIRKNAVVGYFYFVPTEAFSYIVFEDCTSYNHVHYVTVLF